jgi:hypothetical protein
MKTTLTVLTGLQLLVFSAAGLLMQAQETKSAEAKPAAKKQERKSPHEESAFTVGGKKITINYGRPYKRGRVIFGGLEPWGKVWRTGADEATIFTTEGDLMVGSLHVAAGSYSLFTIPNESEWTLILNKTVKQWGAFKYDQAMDYGRTAMKVQKVASPMEQLTINIEPKSAKEGTLRIAWDDTVATADIMAH